MFTSRVLNILMKSPTKNNPIRHIIFRIEIHHDKFIILYGKKQALLCFKTQFLVICTLSDDKIMKLK